MDFIEVEDIVTGKKESLTPEQYKKKYGNGSKDLCWDKEGKPIEKPKKRFIYNLPINNYKQNAEAFYELRPYFYDERNLFWLWNEEQNKYEITDDVELRRLLDNCLGFKGQTIDPKTKAGYLEALKWVGREKKPKDAPLKWVQFKDRAYSLSSGEIYNVTPDYFFTNPIPWELGESTETPQMDKLFKDWVGEAYVETLYEIIAYCCYRDYPIHLIFCLVGSGRNGKSKYQNIVEKFFNKDNICATELDTLIDNRFESFKLYKKLVCSMGETNFGVMKKTSLLKKLSGQDLIGFEKKNKDPFDDHNYAKIIISSNSLPTSTDTSDGFYRRWLILDFPNEFSCDKGDILKTIPEHEYNNLARKMTVILPKLLSNNKFHNQGDIDERKQKYIENSNPLTLFIDKCCIRNEDNDEVYISYNELYNNYIKFLRLNKKRKVSRAEFKTALLDEGLFPEKTSKTIGHDENTGYAQHKVIMWVDGIKMQENWLNFAKSTPFAHVLTQKLRKGVQLKTMVKEEKKANLPEIVDIKPMEFDSKVITYHKCEVEGCNEVETNQDSYKVHYCKKHWDNHAQ